MTERYPADSFGTESQKKLGNAYFEISECGDWVAENCAYIDFMNNNK